MKAIPTRLLFAFLALGILVRIVIGSQLMEDPLIPKQAVFVAFGIGIYHDLWAFLLVASPLALARLIYPPAMRGVLFVVCIVILVITFAELFFWWEFSGRLDRLVFHYLLFPREVLVFLEDQFYVSVFVIPVLAVGYAVFRVISGRPPLDLGSRVTAAGAVAFAVVCVLWIEPWAFSDSRQVNEMASNGYLSILRAASMDEGRWHGEYWELANREPAPRPKVGSDYSRVLSGVKHVVLIIEESFGGRVWQDPDLRERYLPTFSRLMEQGVYFSRVYATGSRTTRGFEAVLNGYPPLPGIAVIRREGYERLPSLARALSDSGFHSIFVNGGWSNFSNLSTYFRATGFAEQTNRDDFLEPSFETSWGVADEDIFARVRTEMSRLTAIEERVFLATITVSHHRPFDFPPGRIDFPASERRSEFAMAYADWALGDFLDKARREPWFADTLFIVVSDHGPRIAGNGPIPVHGYRIPLVFYSPQNLVPAQSTNIGSSMSIGVTLLNLLGLENAEGLYGTDLFSEPVGVVPVEHDYHVGLITETGLTVLHRKGEISSWEVGAKGLIQVEADVVSGARAARLFGNAHDWFYSN